MRICFFFILDVICRGRWHNIRDHYRKSIKRLAREKKTDGRKFKGYKYWKHLLFLNQFLDISTDRVTKKLTEVKEENSGSNDASETFPSQLLEVKKKESVDETENEEQDVKPDLKMDKAVNKETKDGATSQVSIYSVKKAETSDAIGAFLQVIGATLRNLSPYHQNLAKTDIFNIVQKYELQMIVEETHNEQNSTHSSANSTETNVVDAAR